MWFESDHYSNQNQVFTLFKNDDKITEITLFIYNKFITFIFKKII